MISNIAIGDAKLFPEIQRGPVSRYSTEGRREYSVAIPAEPGGQTSKADGWNVRTERTVTGIGQAAVPYR